MMEHRFNRIWIIIQRRSGVILKVPEFGGKDLLPAKVEVV
jgi:hypothetical protein